MLELAARTIGRILYGSDMATALPQVKRFDYINEEMLRRSVRWHPLPLWVPTPANRKLKDGLSVLRRLVTDIIADRRAQGDEGATDDMLGLLFDRPRPGGGLRPAHRRGGHRSGAGLHARRA